MCKYYKEYGEKFDHGRWGISAAPRQTHDLMIPWDAFERDEAKRRMRVLCVSQGLGAIERL